jgi:hypothetical protein
MLPGELLETTLLFLLIQNGLRPLWRPSLHCINTMRSECQYLRILSTLSRLIAALPEGRTTFNFFLPLFNQFQIRKSDSLPPPCRALPPVNPSESWESAACLPAQPEELATIPQTPPTPAVCTLPGGISLRLVHPSEARTSPSHARTVRSTHRRPVLLWQTGGHQARQS